MQVTNTHTQIHTNIHKHTHTHTQSNSLRDKQRQSQMTMGKKDIIVISSNYKTRDFKFYLISLYLFY